MKAELSNMRAQAELFYSNFGNSYSNQTGALCETATGTAANLFGSGTTTGSLVSLANDLVLKAGTGKTGCVAGGTTWAASAKLSDGSFWCVDNTGKSATSSGQVISGSSTCN